MSAPAWNSRTVLTFDGQFDTHIDTGEDYGTRTLTSLFSLNPTSKPKASGPAFIPSSYVGHDGREHATQRARGSFVALTGDVDSGDHDRESIEALVRKFVGNAAWLIYSSAHARLGDMRWRIIIPLDEPQPFFLWHDAQCALFNLMEVAGVAMDQAMARAAQPVYLPNVPPVYPKTRDALRDAHGRPLFYQRSSTGVDAPGLPLDCGPIAASIAAIVRQRALDDVERDRMRKEAERRAGNRPTSDDGQIIRGFNQSISIAQLLELYGYERSPRHAEDWRSPHQQGDSYATRILGDKWVSLSTSDVGARLGTPCAAGCFGDAYDLFVHFEHGGDHRSAFRALYAERRRAC